MKQMQEREENADFVFLLWILVGLGNTIQIILLIQPNIYIESGKNIHTVYFIWQTTGHY